MQDNGVEDFVKGHDMLRDAVFAILWWVEVFVERIAL